jgi:hypothetical protein
MAYKFQLGSAVLSGSTKFEEQLDAAGGIKLTVDGAHAMVVGDDILFQDSDGTMKREGVGDFMTLVAGDGLGVASSQLKINVDDSTIETDSDGIRLKDNGVTLAKMAGLARGKFIIGDSSGDPSALALGSGGQFLVSDGDDLLYRSLSGDATMNAAGALTIAADSVHGTMLNTDAADTTTIELSSDTLSVLKVPNALSQGDGIAAFSYDGSGALTVALSASIAGNGLDYASGVLKVNIDEFGALGSAALHQTQDKFLFSDNGVEKTITFSNLQDAVFADVSGDATVAAGGALTIASDAVEQSMIADDAVGADQLASNAVVEASIVDNAVTLAKMAGITRGSIILGDSSGDPSLLAKGSAAQFLQSDGTDPSYVSISGDVLIAAGGAATIQANAVEDSMVNDNVATGLAGVGLSASGGSLALDASELSAAAVASGDQFVFQDATDNSTKKESIDDIATFLAGGDGLSASGGVISHPNSAIANKDFSSTVTLSVGYNVPDGTSMGGAVVANMPAPAVGAKVTVKAPGDCSQTNTVTIQGATMDGVTSLVLEGPGASVTLICNNAGSDSWVIV